MEHNACTGISDVRYFSPRLLAALTGILSSPLTVIEAPMGYGKTVAVREFLRRENLAVIWVSVLDSPDGAFWRSLCREFGASARDGGNGASAAAGSARLSRPMTRPDAMRRWNCWRASTLPDPPCWSWTMCTCWLPRRRASAFSRYWPGRP